MLASLFTTSAVDLSVLKQVIASNIGVIFLRMTGVVFSAVPPLSGLSCMGVCNTIYKFVCSVGVILRDFGFKFVITYKCVLAIHISTYFP